MITPNIGMYVLDPNGYLSVLQTIECAQCHQQFDAFIRMDYVEEDVLQADVSPCCNKPLSIITFRGN